MLLRKLVVVGLVGFVSFAANIATAEDAGGPHSTLVGVDNASFVDPSEAFADRFDLSFGEASDPRFINFAPSPSGDDAANRSDYRRYEVELVAHAGAGFDVAFAQRAGLGFNRHGDLERESRGSELRFGRVRSDEPSSEPTWYFFAASEDEALTWRPGVRNDFGGRGSSFTVQDRVEIGDMQAGVTYERDGWQASVAYVQREVSVRTGARTISHDEDFTGLTLTMRH
ncbi:MAG TPA: hypothetical protein VEA80_03880 [Vitreimonas sp.]|uniref:hypothetical protein n=1 Tax=Vitreimonas sp. TaxID=3069702 RepID=UPI002D3D585E|nr:hypothetical protein [Vitreimonas sp.]HYD86589.1 hypothetical protein [Vitreimonas sp.]